MKRGAAVQLVRVQIPLLFITRLCLSDSLQPHGLQGNVNCVTVFKPKEWENRAVILRIQNLVLWRKIIIYYRSTQLYACS